MKNTLLLFLALAAATLTNVRAETETIDLKALAKKARPAVMLLVVSDATGKEIATGTGFLVSSDGKLITNFHVIEGAASAVAKAENGGLFPVEGVLASDPKNDLVLLKIKAKDQPFLTLGDSEKIEVGTRIAVIGSPLGLEGTLSEGIVSARRVLMGEQRLFQFTAPVLAGSSGSPVLNATGDIIGVASVQLLHGNQSLNLAVPSECTIRLLTKVHMSTKPQSLQQFVITGVDAIFADPDYPGWAAEATVSYTELLRRAKILVNRYPDNAAAYFALGCAYARLNFTEDAIVSLRQAIKLNPDHANAWNNLGGMYDRLAHTDDATTAYRQAITLEPDYSDAWYNLGRMHHKSARFDEAITAYQRAIKLKSDDPDTWYNLAVACGKLGRLADAIAAYQQATKIKPDHAAAWYNLGFQCLKSGRKDDAIVAYLHVVKLTPNDADAWNNLGIAYRQSGRTEEARAAFAQAQRLQPLPFNK